MRAIFLCCVCLVASPAFGEWKVNFADNPSVEDDANRDRLPDAWQMSAYRSPAKLDWDDRVAHSGKHSLRIRDSKHTSGKDWDENTGRWVSATKRPVTPGTTYTLEAWVKTKGVTGRAAVQIAWWNEGKWLAESSSQPVTGTSDWQRVTLTAKAPAEANSAVIYLGLGNSQGTAWFDDINMIEGDRLPENYYAVGLPGSQGHGIEALATLHAGDVWLRGVPFRIGRGASAQGIATVVLQCKGLEKTPAAVAVPLDQKCGVLYFLHACTGAKAGSRVGQYELVYGDGQTTAIPLRCDREITDLKRPLEAKESVVGWEATDGDNKPVALGLFPLVNPRPEAKIKAIRLVATQPGATLILAGLTTADGTPLLTERPIRYEFNDTSKWYPFTFTLDDTSRDTIDLSYLLDGPAGKHGFVSVGKDGHFYFADRTRARFFGTNVCGRAACPEKEEAKRVAARLAKYGVNLLRIHAIDTVWSPVIDYSKGDSRHLDAAAMDRLDFFFAELKRRGIYVYFDMLDYRQFAEADGVKDASQFEHGWHRSIKGASCYNDRMIELQKEFAEKFFTHHNPYTRLRYVDDPAVAVVEITNENSVFYFQNTTLTLPCYLEELNQRWNQWLLARYNDRAGLAAAWTDAKGRCALAAEEDPARSNVVLPLKWLYQRPEDADYVGPRSPARVNAMVRFLFDLERRYYTEMRAHLTKIGIKVPITGTNQTFCPASNFADAMNDFMSRNNYWCHPAVHAKPFFRFQNRAALSSELPKESNPVTEVASSTVAKKPMIVPEFNFPWPNEFRAEGLLMMTAYGCLQDWDGLLFFTYSPGEEMLSWFGNQSDPVRWGEYPAAALMFHRHDVSTAKNTVHIGYSETDIFSARPSHAGDASSPFRYLSYLSKVRNSYFKESYSGDADVVISSGYSPVGSYENARRAILLAKSPWADRSQRQRNRALIAGPWSELFTSTTANDKIPLAFQRFLGEEKTWELTVDTLADVTRLPAGAVPVGLTADGRHSLGFAGERVCVVPDASALGKVDPVWDYRLFATAARRWGLPGYDKTDFVEHRYVSDTGELVLDRTPGFLQIQTPKTKGAVGFLGEAGRVELGGVTVECRTPFAAVVVSSLDSEPLGASRRVLITAVARAENTGQAFSDGKRTVPDRGREPVLVEPVQCLIRLAMPAAAIVYPLDPTGKRREPVAATFEQGTLRVDLEGVRSPWCEVIVGP
jgi:hypothetical protein